LILVGPTGIGKSLWAKSIRPDRHVRFGGKVALGKLGITRQTYATVETDKYDYAIFDDLQGGLKFFHSYKNWLGHEPEFDATAKYAGDVTIAWGRPAIYISNNNEYELDRSNPEIDWAWLEERCLIVKVESWETGKKISWVEDIGQTGEEGTVASTEASQNSIGDATRDVASRNSNGLKGPTQFHT